MAAKSKEPLIIHDFNLPSHVNELSKAEDIIKKLKLDIDNIILFKNIDKIKHEYYFNEVVNILDYIGRLSISAFNIQDDVENIYLKKYPKAPKLAKFLWYKHYEQLHNPYDILKNRCFRLLDELDNTYINVHQANPPNWEI